MQRRLAVLAAALLALTAGCSAHPGASNPETDVRADGGAAAAPGDGERTVAVGAGGRVRTAPDRAVVRVAVTARADAVGTVRERLAGNASRMRAALEEAGLGADRVASSRFHIDRNHEHDERPAAPEFRGRHEFVVTLDDVDRAGEVVVTAVRNGATRVEEVRFTVAPETRRDLRRRALDRAVENARGEASVAADGTGLALDGVRTVRTTDVSTDPIRHREYALATAADAGGASTSFESGKVTVTARVVVVYEATAARPAP
jgi:hypothetical protein